MEKKTTKLEYIVYGFTVIPILALYLTGFITDYFNIPYELMEWQQGIYFLSFIFGYWVIGIFIVYIIDKIPTIFKYKKSEVSGNSSHE